MSDIVERLRLSITKGHEPTDEDAIEAAAEIERLRNALANIAGITEPPGHEAHGLQRARETARRALEQKP